MSAPERPSMLSLLSATTPIVVAVIGAWFTNLYKENEAEANRIAGDRLELERQQRLLIDKAAVVKQYFDYLANKSDSNQQRAALAVLASLGYSDLVIRVVATDPTPSNVQALAAIASTGDKDETNSAMSALESLRTNQTNEISAAAEQALTNAQATPSVNGAKQTAIVAGADKTLEAAQTEVRRLKEAGIDNAQVIKKDDWYRTVVPVNNELRQQTLANVQQRVRKTAYAVDLEKWCDKSRTDCVTATNP